MLFASHLITFIFMSVNSTRGAGSNHQLYLSKWAPRKALEPFQVQTFGLKISRMTYARINRRPDSESFWFWNHRHTSIKNKLCEHQWIIYSTCVNIACKAGDCQRTIIIMKFRWMFMTIILGYVTGFLLLTPLEHEPFNDDDDHLFQFNWRRLTTTTLICKNHSL